MFKRALSLLAGIVLLTGCGSSGDSGTPETSTPPPAVGVAAPFTGVVALQDFSATCREVACWLPVQFKTELVSGETVSLRDKWPMEGDEVRVLCETTGAKYRDAGGHEVNIWYGIQTPQRYLEPGAGDRAEKIGTSNDRRGYVGAAWIKGGYGKRAPSC